MARRVEAKGGAVIIASKNLGIKEEVKKMIRGTGEGVEREIEDLIAEGLSLLKREEDFEVSQVGIFEGNLSVYIYVILRAKKVHEEVFI